MSVEQRRRLSRAAPVAFLLFAMSVPVSAAHGQGAAPAAPKVNRVVMGIVPPSNEAQDPSVLDQISTWQLRPIYEYLLGTDAKTGKLVPELATEWALEGTPEAPAYRFRLRQGVQFHDGWGEFTAKDVKFSIEYCMRENARARGGNLPTYFNRIVDRIEVVSDYEVVFRLKRPDIDFLSALSEDQGGCGEMMSLAHWQKIGEPTLSTAPLAGTAPYQFQSRALGSSIVFKRVPYKHWSSLPDFPEFEFRFQPEASTRLASFLSGETHVTSLPDDLIKQATGARGKVIHGNVPALRAFVAALCCFVTPKGPLFPKSPIGDVRVRQALNKAIDRNAINAAFFEGEGETVYLSGFSPTRAGWDPTWKERFNEMYGYDPAAARKLLAAAGYGPSRPLTTNIFLSSIAQLPAAEKIVEAISGYWHAIGVDAKLLVVDPARVAAERRAMKYGNHWQITGTSANQIVGLTVYNTSSMVNLGFQDPIIDKLLPQLRGTLDTKEQDKLWREIGNKGYELFWDIPLFWLPTKGVINPDIVESYSYPGNITGTWTHVENIKAPK